MRVAPKPTATSSFTLLANRQHLTRKKKSKKMDSCGFEIPTPTFLLPFYRTSTRLETGWSSGHPTCGQSTAAARPTLRCPLQLQTPLRLPRSAGHSRSRMPGTRWPQELRGLFAKCLKRKADTPLPALPLKASREQQIEDRVMEAIDKLDAIMKEHQTSASKIRRRKRAMAELDKLHAQWANDCEKTLM